MFKFEVILKGGLKGCCSTYSAAQLNELTVSWFEKEPDILFHIMDVEEDYWESDKVADYGYKLFGDRFFPLTYLNENLVLAGFFPEKKDLLESIKNPKPITISDLDQVKTQSLQPRE